MKYLKSFNEKKGERTKKGKFGRDKLWSTAGGVTSIPLRTPARSRTNKDGQPQRRRAGTAQDVASLSGG